MLIADNEAEQKKWINHLRSFSTGDRVIEGWLSKKGAQLTGWKKRYFVCLQGTREVLYFRSEADSAGPNICDRALGSIHLEGSNIKETSEKDRRTYGKGNAVFEIETSSRTGTIASSQVNFKLDKNYVLSAANTGEMGRWIRKLQLVTNPPTSRSISVDIDSSYEREAPTTRMTLMKQDSLLALENE